MTGIAICPPLDVTAAMIVGTDVPEADYAAYDSATNYALGERSISLATHKIYQAALAAAGHPPAAVTIPYWAPSFPCTVQWAAHGLVVGMWVTFTTTGTLPTGLSASPVKYYVMAAGFALDSFQVSATLGGPAVYLSGAGTGTHTATPGGNVGFDPTDPLNIGVTWLEVSPTNRYKLFDTRNNSKTTQANSFYYEIAPGVALDTVYGSAFEDATSMRVRLTDPTYGVVYDQTIDLSPLPDLPDFWEWCFGHRASQTAALFTAIPGYPAAVLRVDLVGGSGLAIGSLILSQSTSYGTGIAYGARVGRVSYSRQQVNEWGDMDLIPRATAQKLQVTARVYNTEIDQLDAHLAALDSVPCLFILYAAHASTIVFGIYKSYEVLIAYPTASDVAFDFLGFT